MSLETNKLAAAVLLGGMVTLGTGLVADAIYPPRERHAEAEAAPAGAEAAGGGVPASPAPAEAAAMQPSVALIAAADPAMGEKIAAKCKTCHTFEKGGPNRVGPNLWGVVGAKHAHMEGFPYSAAIQAMADKTWSFEELDHFIYSPKDYAKGTKMTFAGLKKAEERAALLRWLRDQSDSPLPLPGQ